jgi:hypothetical protein
LREQFHSKLWENFFPEEIAEIVPASTIVERDRAHVDRRKRLLEIRCFST